jgi:rhamnulose-1-phosphate aldolase
MIKHPQSNFGIVMIKDSKLVFLSEHENQLPSSELNSHLMIHQYLANNNPKKRALLHTHPTFLIAWSHKYYSYPKDKLNLLLESMMPEVGAYIPRGTGFVDTLSPGSSDLAHKTVEELIEHDIVIWMKHGVLGTGDNLWEIVDMIDILDKAAQIALLSGALPV